MTEVNVPIGSPVVKNIDGALLDDSSYRLIDGYADKDQNINSRPGILLGARLLTGAAIDGIYWWDKLQRVILVSGGYVWVMDINFSGVNLGSAASLMLTGVRPTFATDGTYLYIANGGRIVKTNGVTLVGTLYVADADAPTACTHVINVDGYILANNVGSSKINFSALNDGSTWAALDFFTAEGNSDDTVALYEFQREIYIFGKASLEQWEDDGATPFSRITGGYKNVGCIAPYSIVNTDDGVIWLDHRKRFVRYSGGGIEHIGTPYDEEIQSFDIISDCQADRIDIVGREFYVFAFPSEGRTLVYNLTEDNWSEFGYWNSSGGFHERFIGNTYCFSPAWNRHIWGTLKPDGAIYKMSQDYTADDGNPIRMQSITGHISYGTNKLKKSRSLIIRAKRGRIGDSSDPQIAIRFNDDNSGFGNEISMSLGKMGDYFNFLKLDGLGMYRTRQYEFTVTDNLNVAFGHAKEDIYAMGR